ncbi:MAG: hypothetical protein JWM63_1523 [Gammaproteobacteria bacterium]|jgi:hypothetical protein|nr:hypothetical protein [Gammaproteobacteria bacterium]
MPREPVGARGPALIVTLVATLLVSACATDLFPREHPTQSTPPVVNKAAATSTALTDDLQLLQKLVQGTPSEQAEIGAAAQRDYETAPTPSRQLRFALILATPGHPGTDLPRAQRLLRELMANPEMLMASERALAFLELQQIDDHLTLEAENRRLQSDAVRADKERLATVNRRLQLETDENTRLRRDLEEARAKLDAIANIERSLNERKPSNEGRPK